MQTLLAWLKLFPALLAAVRELEAQLPLPGTGKEKLDLLIAIIKTLYDAEETIRKEIPFDRLAGIVRAAVDVIVASLNALGLFQRTPVTPTSGTTGTTSVRTSA